jgi:hypothetical protein
MAIDDTIHKESSPFKTFFFCLYKKKKKFIKTNKKKKNSIVCPMAQISFYNNNPNSKVTLKNKPPKNIYAFNNKLKCYKSKLMDQQTIPFTKQDAKQLRATQDYLTWITEANLRYHTKQIGAHNTSHNGRWLQRQHKFLAFEKERMQTDPLYKL